jgi:hypothetical protein
MSRRVLYLSVFLGGVLLAATCTPTSPTSVATTTPVATLQVDADAGCTAKSAFAGDAGEDLVIISPCFPSSERALTSGGRITVDPAGEGYLDFTSTTGEKRIWVLHKSVLLLCTVGPDEDPTPAECINGFGVWNNNNPGTVAITPNATVTLVGTYVLIGYIEDAEKTIVLPFDGGVLVQGDPEGNPGEGEPVEVGSFWSFGAGDERIGNIEEFAEVAADLGIESWVVSAAQHAALDGFPPGRLLAGEAVNLLGAGAFGTEDGGDVFLNGVFWQDIAAEVSINALMGSRGGLNVLDFADEFDPSRLEELAAELGGEQVVVFFEGAAGRAVASAVAEQLEALQFNVAVEVIDLGFGRQELSRADQEGQTALLVTGL